MARVYLSRYDLLEVFVSIPSSGAGPSSCITCIDSSAGDNQCPTPFHSPRSLTPITKRAFFHDTASYHMHVCMYMCNMSKSTRIPLQNCLPPAPPCAQSVYWSRRCV